MKRLFLVFGLMVALNYSALSQEESQEETPDEIVACLPEIGKANDSALNDCEGKILNYKFFRHRGSFDFTGKRVAFFSGNTGTVRRSPKDYFEGTKRSYEKWGIVFRAKYDYIVFFDEEEAKQTGYDAVIIWGSKKPLTKGRARALLKKNRLTQ